MADTYKATFIKILQVETMVPPMQVHLDQLQAKACFCLEINSQAAFIRKQCKKIVAKLRKRRVDTAPNTFGVQKAQWASTIIKKTAYTPTAPTRSPLCLPP